MIKDFGKYIKRTNKKFLEASKAEQRVIIAQDAIYHIERGINIQEGIFINVNGYNDCQLQEIVNDYPQECTCCQKGLMFASIIGRVNKLKVSGIEHGNEIYDDQHKKLLEYFSKSQLDLMEIAFEGTSYLRIVNESSFTKGYDFHNNYNNPEERSLEICKNIIKNKGTFKL